MKVVTDALKAALDQIVYLPNAVHAWETAHGGNKVLASANAAKLETAERLLSEVLNSLPNAKTYTVIGLEQGRVVTFASEAEFIRAMASRGITLVAYETNERLVTELHNAPKFNKLVGPIYGGPGVVRYETQEIYDQLSR